MLISLFENLDQVYLVFDALDKCLEQERGDTPDAGGQAHKVVNSWESQVCFGQAWWRYGP